MPPSRFGSPTRARAAGSRADPAPLRVVERGELQAGRVAGAGDANLEVVGSEPFAGHTIGVPHRRDADGSPERIAVGARLDLADKVVAAPDVLVVEQERLWVGDEDIDETL